MKFVIYSLLAVIKKGRERNEKQKSNRRTNMLHALNYKYLMAVPNCFKNPVTHSKGLLWKIYKITISFTHAAPKVIKNNFVCHYKAEQDQNLT